MLEIKCEKKILMKEESMTLLKKDGKKRIRKKA